MRNLLFLLLSSCSVPVADNLTSYINSTPVIEIDINEEIEGQGTGVVISCHPSEPGLYTITVLTAKHVIGLVVNPIAVTTLKFPDGDTVVVQEIKIHPSMDVAILKAKINRFIAPIVLDSCTPKLADPVWVIGYPVGLGPVITEGYVSGPIETEGEKLILSSGHVYYGNSGGPVINKTTHTLVGIVVQRIQTHHGIVEHLHAFVPIVYFLDWLKVTV